MNTNDENLEHHGVKGQKWGVIRKSRSSSSGKTGYQKKAKSLSDAELNKRIKRMELEKKYSDLNLAATSPGRHFAQNILSNQSKVAIGTLISVPLGFAVRKGLESKFGK